MVELPLLEQLADEPPQEAAERGLGVAQVEPYQQTPELLSHAHCTPTVPKYEEHVSFVIPSKLHIPSGVPVHGEVVDESGVAAILSAELVCER